MTKHVNPRRVRGVVDVRAEASQADVKQKLDDINQLFAEFKQSNDERLAGVEKKFDDVVTNEKVDKINAEVGEAQKELDQLNARIAALQVGPNSGQDMDPAKAEYSKQFNRFFRKGERAVEGDLGELAVKASLQTQSDPDGGYVVPEQMEQGIDRVLATVSAMRSLARVLTISAPLYKKLVNKGGASSGWVGETDSRPETDTPELSALEFPTKELYANPAATQTLLDDSSVDIGSWLSDEVTIEFAEQEGDAFINGDGASEPRGLLGYDTVANASYAWGKLGFVVSGKAGDFADSNPSDNVLDLVYGLRRPYRQNARFLLNDLTASKVRKFKDGDGNYLWQPSAQQGEPARLMGYPVEIDDNMPDVAANKFPIAFGDFQRGYLIVDRVGIRVLRDPYTNKPYVHFYTTKRVGGGVQNFEAIKLFKIST